MTSTATGIAALAGAQAIRALALVLDHDQPLPGPGWLRGTDPGSAPRTALASIPPPSLSGPWYSSLCGPR